MAEETTEQFLDRRERELSNRAAALRGQLAPIEAELAKIRRTKAMWQSDHLATSALALQTLAGQAVNNLPGVTELHSGMDSGIDPPHTYYATRTIKDLVIQALLDGFPHGASTGDLRSFILSGYGRTIDPGSLRTQIHRLKGAGILRQHPYGDIWDFQNGKRALYQRYDHPTSRQGMRELQDDSPDSAGDDDHLFQKAAELAWRDENQTETEAAERLEEIRLHRVTPSDAPSQAKTVSETESKPPGLKAAK